MKNKIKIILPVKDIPENATVTLIGGSYKYCVRSDLKIDQVVVQSSGCRFMFGITNPDSISTVPETKEVLWVTTEDELYDWLEARRDVEDDK